MNLYIYKFNNYYNRILKKHDNFNDYDDFLLYGPVASVHSFNPNDGVNTTQIIGALDNVYDGTGDYLLAVNSDNTINSRWFIIKNSRTREGQYQLTLRRDLLVDYYEYVINSPCFIEKAILSDNNPLIFNDEGISTNQIKTSETPLKDATGCAWIVGYYDYGGLNETLKINAGATNPAYDKSVGSSFEVWKESNFGASNKVKGNVAEHILSISLRYRGLVNTYELSTKSSNVKALKTTTSDSNNVEYPIHLTYPYYEFPSNEEVYNNSIAKTFENLPFYDFVNNEYGFKSNEIISDLMSYDNKIVRFVDSSEIKFYNINIVRRRASDVVNVYNNSLYFILKDAEHLGNYNLNITFPQTLPNTSKALSIFSTFEEFELIATPVEASNVKLSFDKSKIRAVNDAPYGIFALPYPEKEFEFNGVKMTKEFSYNVAQKLATTLSSFMWDLQLVPYCPVLEYKIDDTGINWPITGEDAIDGISTPIFIDDESSEIVGYVLHAVKSSFTLDIPLKIQYKNVKLTSQCDMWRLSSPNYNGQFEFNVAKNGGVNGFNVDCTYLPAQPYIHVNPDFGLLYGQDFNDARGLICGGNFSLPILKDAWMDYVTSNKNYQNIFDRQISNMEVQHKYQRIQDVVGAVSGTIAGVSQGAMTGLITGGVAGGVAGGIVGGVASAVGGVADIAINESIRREAIDYSKDLFGYQLDNIKALPNSLAQTTAYTFNNKIFPILEYYTCTKEERDAVANKIAYNSMTVMAIGKISDFIGNTWAFEDLKDKGYIKAQLIRLENDENYQIVNSIAGELSKGVYFK